MIILGLDVGLATTGFGVIDDFRILDFGVISTPTNTAPWKRLVHYAQVLHLAVTRQLAIEDDQVFVASLPIPY